MTSSGSVELTRLCWTPDSGAHRSGGRRPQWVVHRSNPEEFRREAVALFRSSDRSRVEVARSLGISDGSLASWVKAADESENPGALDPTERADSRVENTVRTRQVRLPTTIATAYPSSDVGNLAPAS